MRKINNNFYKKICFLEKINYKLAKNRESARNSRKRKKVYFELLEAKAMELNNELQKAKKKIKKLEEGQDKLSYHTKIVFLFFYLKIYDLKKCYIR